MKPNRMILLTFVLALSNCVQKQTLPMKKHPSSPQTVTAPIVAKPFFKKNGERTELMEYYIQRSIQDYFIKFCESDITIEELESHLRAIDSPLKTITLEIELREGEWDDCDESTSQQSRIGWYAVVYRIITPE